MKFTINPKIFWQYPETKLGVVVGLNIDNSKKDTFVNLLKETQQEIQSEITGLNLKEHPKVAVWRDAYKKFGAKPSKYLSSIEAIFKRLQKGNFLNEINPLVDLYNALSFKYYLPFGAEDLDKIFGEIRLTFAIGNETGKHLGSNKKDSCKNGEVAYLDALGFICRRWNWREAERTMITPKTKNFVLVTEGLASTSKKEIQAAACEFTSEAKEKLGGEYQVFYLDKDNNSFEMVFETGSKLIEKDEIGVKKIDQKQTAPVQKGKKQEQKKYLSPTAKKLVKVIRQALTALKISFKDEDITLNHPTNSQFGDFSCNIAMQLYGQNLYERSLAFSSPRDLAQAIAEQIQKALREDSLVIKVEVAGPGFINFIVDNKFYLQQLEKMVSDKADLIDQTMDGKKVMVEFTDPNPFKEFHIGHLYSNIVGECLSRLYEANGATVKRVCYQGDVGMHVAKSIWGMMKKMADEKLDLEELKKWPLNKRMTFLGQAYAMGATVYKKNKKTVEEIKDLNYLIYLSGQENLQETTGWEPQVDYKQHVQDTTLNYAEIKTVYQIGRAWSLEYFETIYKRLGTIFEDYFFESLVGEIGAQIVNENLDNGVFEKSAGAIIFPGEKHGLHNRVFINSFGLPTYEAKELGLAVEKYNRWPYDLSIPVTGNEIDEYFKVLMKALEQTKPDLAKKTTHVSHGMVRLPEGKMSSRSGKILRGEWLIEEAKKRVVIILDENRKDLDDKEKDKISEKVGQGAIKFALLSASLGRDIAFDFEKSLSFTGFSGPYLQYTYARCQSVLNKAELNLDELKMATIKRLNIEEIELIKVFSLFNEIVHKATDQLAPHFVSEYIYELAQSFNTFYNKHSILKADSKEQKQFRLALTKATAEVIKRGLWLLGIEVLEKM